MRRILVSAALALALALAHDSPAPASSRFTSLFRTTYPFAANSRIDSCFLCHQNGSYPTSSSPQLNPYGSDWQARGHNFRIIEPVDSDVDAASNLAEIRALKFPGDDSDFPPPALPACVDVDGDGYGDPGLSTCRNGGARDCDDSIATVHPGATEVCGDGLDNDCYGGDEPCPSIWFKDTDADGYSDGTSVSAVSEPPGFRLAADLVATFGDCDDTDAGVHPSAVEVCDNGRDEDCDGGDEVCVVIPVCPDADGDGYEDAACGGPDCDDENPGVFPGGEETCGNAVDEDCDGYQEVCPSCPEGGVLAIKGVLQRRKKQALHIVGLSTVGQSVTVTDADTGAFLGESRVRRGRWHVKLRGLEELPYAIVAVNDEGCVADREVRPRPTILDDEELGHGESPESFQHPYGWTNPKRAHGDYVEHKGFKACLSCHTFERGNRGQAESCMKCHFKPWRRDFNCDSR